MYYEIAVLSKY